MTSDQRVYLAQILEAADRIAAYTERGKAAFLTDQKTQDAVARTFQIIGKTRRMNTPGPYSHMSRPSSRSKKTVTIRAGIVEQV